MSGTGYCNCSELRQELSTTKAQLAVCNSALEAIISSNGKSCAGASCGDCYKCYAIMASNSTQPLNSLRRLVEACESVSQIPELNMNNYNDEDVRNLQNDLLGVDRQVREALAEVKKEFGL